MRQTDYWLSVTFHVAHVAADGKKVGAVVADEINNCLFCSMENARLLVTIEDCGLLAEIKQAIGMLRGVVSVETEPDYNETTLAAMRDCMEGRTVKFDSFDDYLRKTR